MKENSFIVGDELHDTEEDTSPDGTSSSMSPLTTLPTHRISPFSTHCPGAFFGSLSNKSTSDFETPQSTTCPVTASASNPPIADPSSIIATRPAMSPSNSITPTLANPTPSTLKDTSKKGKGRTIKRSGSGKTKGHPKNMGNQPNIVIINSTQVECHPSTQKSSCGEGLKHKQADREVASVAEKSGPVKKKSRLQDRWFYEPVILGINPTTQCWARFVGLLV